MADSGPSVITTLMLSSQLSFFAGSSPLLLGRPVIRPSSHPTPSIALMSKNPNDQFIVITFLPCLTVVAWHFVSLHSLDSRWFEKHTSTLVILHYLLSFYQLGDAVCRLSTAQILLRKYNQQDSILCGISIMQYLNSSLLLSLLETLTPWLLKFSLRTWASIVMKTKTRD